MTYLYIFICGAFYKMIPAEDYKQALQEECDSPNVAIYSVTFKPFTDKYGRTY